MQNMIFKTIAASVAIAALAAPALAGEHIPASSDYGVTTVVTPDVGTTRTVGAGETVLHVQNRADYKVWALLDDGKAGPWLLTRKIPAGTRLYPVETSKAFKACVSPTGTGGCFIDDDGDGRFDRQSEDTFQIFRKEKGNPRYGQVNASSESDFEYVIKFSGADADTLRFSYREFKGDMARDAFTEELTIPREAFPQMIRLKSHVLRIDSVSGMGMAYTVVE